MYRSITMGVFGVVVLTLLAVMIAVAAPDDEQHERAETLRHRDDRHRELETLHRHLEDMHAERKELPWTDDGDVRHRMEERIEATKRRMAQIAEEEKQRSRRHREYDRKDPRRPDELREIARRIQHMHCAAENLIHAGERDLARDLHERAEDMERELQRRREHNETRHRGIGHAELREIHGAIHELRREIGQLRDQVNELCKIVERKGRRERL